MEYHHFYKNTYILEGLDTSCVYKLDQTRCVIIDNGYDKEWEQLRELIMQEQLTPVAVICTHLHVDHHGNSVNLRNEFGARIYMPEGEADKCANIMTLRRYVGYPYRDDYYKWMVDEKIHCKVDYKIGMDEESVEIEGAVFKIVRTPGHSCDHVCVITPDNVCFIGDVIMPEENIKAAKLPYCEDYREDRKSKLKLKELDCRHWIFSHRGTYVGDIAPIVDMNVEKCDELIESLYHIFDDGPLTRALFEKTARKYLGMHNTRAQRIQEYRRMFRPYFEELLIAKRLKMLEIDGIVYFCQNEN